MPSKAARRSAWEIASSQRRTLDRLVVQVGGGALASACVRGRSAKRSALRAVRRTASRSTPSRPRAPGRFAVPTTASPRAAIPPASRTPRTHRREFMWPWETTPASIAHGILDDETYDWLAVVEGMLATGGEPVVVAEELLADANEVARVTTGVAVDPTGSAGLAGLIALCESGRVADGERVGVLFTGIDRSTSNRRKEQEMRSFLGRDILSLKEFERSDFERVFEVCDELAPIARTVATPTCCSDKTLLTAFYQPSTRTRMSTEAAMHRLGGHVLGFADVEDDTRRRLLPGVDQGHRAHARVLRRRHRDAPLPAGRPGRGGPLVHRFPVINCGDGWGEHPTQVLTDLYTTKKELGTLDGLTVSARRRHAHADDALDPLRRSRSSTSRPTSSDRPRCRCCPEFKAELDEPQRPVRGGRVVPTCISECDVIYMEPVVQADYTSSRVERARLGRAHARAYKVTRDLMSSERSRSRSSCTACRGWTSCRGASTRRATSATGSRPSTAS